MSGTPKTLEDALAALARLENVVDRTVDRVNQLENVDVPVMSRTLDATIEATAEAPKPFRDLGQRMDPAVPASASTTSRLVPRVQSVRVGNRTVRRATNPR